MQRYTVRPALAAALTAGLLLFTAACSSAGDSIDDGIAGIDSGKEKPLEPEGTPDPEATADPNAEDDAIDRPEITLPDDMVNVFEDTDMGDPIKDEIIADVIRRIEAIDLAFAESAPEHEAVAFYSAGDAHDSAIRFIRRSADDNLSWGGTAIYYDFHVDNAERRAKEPIVSFCNDISELYTKALDTGELLAKPDDTTQHLHTQLVVQQNEDGVWQAFQTLPASEEGDRGCER